jgi:hypothetical protein
MNLFEKATHQDSKKIYNTISEYIGTDYKLYKLNIILFDQRINSCADNDQHYSYTRRSIDRSVPRTSEKVIYTKRNNNEYQGLYVFNPSRTYEYEIECLLNNYSKTFEMMDLFGMAKLPLINSKQNYPLELKYKKSNHKSVFGWFSLTLGSRMRYLNKDDNVIKVTYSTFTPFLDDLNSPELQKIQDFVFVGAIYKHIDYI